MEALKHEVVITERVLKPSFRPMYVSCAMGKAMALSICVFIVLYFSFLQVSTASGEAKDGSQNPMESAHIKWAQFGSCIDNAYIQYICTEHTLGVSK